MDFRRLTPNDLDQAIEFAIKGLRAELYPLHMSPAKVEVAARHFLTSEVDFHLAAFDGDRIVGGIAVHINEMLWFQRSEAHIVMLFAVVPGVGFQLLREAMRWTSEHMRIRRVVWPLEDDAPFDRMAHIAMRRFGFNRSQRVLLSYKE